MNGGRVEARDGVDNIAVLTSGGDAQGMNAAVRAVVRTALHHGRDVYAVYEGYRGMVEGGDLIRPLASDDVGGILHQGGTVIGTARSPEFRTREGRRRAALNLAKRGIDALVVIGGDGSLTGANLFRAEWTDHLEDLVAAGQLDREQADAHAHLRIVGMVGSIDNDMFGTDMTIGADTALHRITEAVDAILSTAASHQRTFVIEVMGRHCGYLALMSSLATGANWVLIPEHPPEGEGWERAMCEALAAGREIGRRQNLVVVAEGAQDRDGKPITADYVKDVLTDQLGEDTRITILGHVQRGGSPSAFDRYLSTILGYAAVERLLRMTPDAEPELVGIREHQVVFSPLMQAVEQTHEVAERIEANDYDTAMQMRGGSFGDSFETLRILTRAQPRPAEPGTKPLRLAVIHGGGPAPGMNTAVRVAVRLGRNAGHEMLAVRNGFRGLRDGEVETLDWMSVSGWVSHGGAELGTNRFVPDSDAFYAIAENLRRHRIDGLLMIGGWAGYEAAHALHSRRRDYPPFQLPIVCLPATINNDVPGTDISIGADTALNSIVTDVDKIKQSAVASRRCFVVEVMGHDSGYLAMLGGMATGAEHVYLPEEGITLDDLQADVARLIADFQRGKRLGLIIRGEEAEQIYTTQFIHALFEKEGGDLFDVRDAILGHSQQGGNPSPFDRIQATRFAARCIEFLCTEATASAPSSAFIGLQKGKLAFTDLARFPDLVEEHARRPREQFWLALRRLHDVMSRAVDHQG
jgi:6-phosphofructokinase 1